MRNETRTLRSKKKKKNPVKRILGSLDPQPPAHDTHTTRTRHLRFLPTLRSVWKLVSESTSASMLPRRTRARPIPGLLNDIVVTHVLRSEYFDDPAELARLPAVSRAMRDAVAATGLEFEELDENEAPEVGCLSALQRLQRGGQLSCQELLCQAAARSGQLEELKVLRADGCPWSEMTCAFAALGRHLDVMQWARANGCPWDTQTCEFAAEHGHLEVLQWARTNGCPWDELTCSYAANGGHLEVLQ